MAYNPKRVSLHLTAEDPEEDMPLLLDAALAFANRNGGNYRIMDHTVVYNPKICKHDVYINMVEETTDGKIYSGTAEDQA